MKNKQVRLTEERIQFRLLESKTSLIEGKIMIAKNIKREQLINKKATVNEETMNGAGHGLGEGTIVTIVDVVRGKGLSIKTDKCLHCNQYTYITGVSREILTLLN